MTNKEQAYRRGVHHGVTWVIDMLRQHGYDEEYMNTMEDEALVMRFDGKAHPLYLHELRKRCSR